MTRIAIFAVAALILTAVGLSHAASAQSVNLPFGGPLGKFKAQSKEPGSSGHYGAKSSYAKSAGEKKVREVARERAAAREKAKTLAAKHRDDAVAPGKTDNASTTPSAPAIIVPPTPEAATPGASANAAPVTTATAPQDGAKAAPEAKETSAPASTGPPPGAGKAMCRKYSAAVGGVIEVPCE